MAHPFTIAASLCMTLAVGCASSQGFDRASLTETLHIPPPSTHSDESISNQESGLTRPLRLGVFFVEHDFPNRQSIRKVEWLSADRDELLRTLESLREQQILTDTFVVMDSTVRAGNIRGIRQAGARYGADMVLIVNGAAAIDRYHNRYAWLYPTVIGAYLAPGTVSDALVMATGSLWAVRSEWHVPIQTVEGVSKVVGSAVLVDESAALQEAKKHAIQTLGQRIVDRLQSWAKEFPPPTLHSR
jgi:rhombotail lipoprotein